MKSRSGCDLGTVLISKLSFFNIAFGLFSKVNHLHGISLPDYYIVSSFFYKTSKRARVPTFVCLFRDDATTTKVRGCDEGTNLS